MWFISSVLMQWEARNPSNPAPNSAGQIRVELLRASDGEVDLTEDQIRRCLKAMDFSKKKFTVYAIQRETPAVLEETARFLEWRHAQSESLLPQSQSRPPPPKLQPPTTVLSTYSRSEARRLF